jgi:hypothetical protein
VEDRDVEKSYEAEADTLEMRNRSSKLVELYLEELAALKASLSKSCNARTSNSLCNCGERVV